MRKYFECLGRIEQWISDFPGSPEMYPILTDFRNEVSLLHKRLNEDTISEYEAKAQIDRLMEVLFNE